MIKKARVINLTICGILYLRRYGNNLQSPKQPPVGVMKAAFGCSGHYDRLRNAGYGKSYGNTIKVIVEAPVYKPCRPVFALGCCLFWAPFCTVVRNKPHPGLARVC